MIRSPYIRHKLSYIPQIKSYRRKKVNLLGNRQIAGSLPRPNPQTRCGFSFLSNTPTAQPKGLAHSLANRGVYWGSRTAALIKQHSFAVLVLRP